MKQVLIIFILFFPSQLNWNYSYSNTSKKQQQLVTRQVVMTNRDQHFLNQLRKGDRKAFLYVEYGILDGSYLANIFSRSYRESYDKPISYGFLRVIAAQANRNNVTPAQWLYKNNPKLKKNVIKALLSGLFNKDVRVRLSTVNLLRLFKPHLMMARDVRRALLVEDENDKSKHWYLYIEAPDIVTYANHNHYKELKKLDQFITRMIWVNRVKKDITALKEISESEFITLTTRIDKESIKKIPMLSPNFDIFTHNEIEAISIGMQENKSNLVRYGCAQFLKRILYHPATADPTRDQIISDLKKAELG